MFLSSVFFYARHLAAMAVLALALWGWGAVALRSFVFASRAESGALRLGAGAAVVATLVFALGLFGLLLRPWLVGLVVCGVILGVVAARPRGLPWARLLLASCLVSPIMLQAFYPPVDWDATSYHLASAKLYLEAHRLVVATYLRYPVFPQLQEMLQALALGIFDDLAAHGITLAMWAGTGLALLALGRRVGSQGAGIVALGLWIGSPTALALGTISYVDLPLTFYVTLACLSWVIYEREKGARWAGLAGFFAGAAAATKYSGLFFVAALGLAVLASSPRGARARPLALFAGFAALIAAPWYARNWILSGDPLFPFLGRVLPNRFWNAADLSWQLTDLARLGGRSLADFALLWGRLAFNQGLFVGPEDVFSPAFWIPLPVLLIARWKSPLERALLVLALAFTCVWFFGAQSGRYLLPALPLLCLGMGTTLKSVASAVLRQRVPAFVVAALLAVPGVWYALARTQARGVPPTTAVARAAFIARAYPSYPLYAWLAGAPGKDKRIHGWRDSPLAYYCPGTYVGDWFGRARYSRLDVALPSASALRDSLDALGVAFLVVPWALGPIDLPVDSLAGHGIVLVHADSGGRVFGIEGPRQAPSD